MGLMDKLDFTKEKLWKSLAVLDKPHMDEPHVLQQQVIYPTEVSPQPETTAPVDEHRLVPISRLVDYPGPDAEEEIPDIVQEDMARDESGTETE